MGYVGSIFYGSGGHYLGNAKESVTDSR